VVHLTRRKERAAVGFTVKSGWTSAVLVIEPDSGPRVVDSQTIDLSDPAIPESRQPYHAGFGTARAAGARLSTLVASVERFGQQSVARLMSGYQAAGYDVRGVGLVVGSLIDPGQIANDHIRIHALEGQLFRGVLEKAAGRHGMPCSIWRERDLAGAAQALLKRTEEELRDTIAALGRGVDGPWRSEQKRAALAGWLVLAGRSAARKGVRGKAGEE
jgi:hypothetical protein